MKKLIYYTFLLLSVTETSCTREDSPNVNLLDYYVNNETETDLDVWLQNNFLQPFNLQVIYKFNRYNAGFVGSDLAPAALDRVQPAMEVMRDVWIQPYLEIAGEAFLKPIIPKQAVLVGSARYNNDGSITLGTADSGMRITMFVLNSFNRTNRAQVTQMMHTVHHEFAHILHQNIPVSPQFEQIAANGYIGNSWVQTTAADARNLGFVTPYSRMNRDEDFVETVATLLVSGQAGFNTIVNAANATGQARLRLKEQYVVQYFQTSYQIDFRALQEQVRVAIDNTILQ